MDAKELRQKTAQELQTTASELRAKLRDLRFNAKLQQGAKIADLRTTRRDLARVNMVLAEASKK